MALRKRLDQNDNFAVSSETLDSGSIVIRGLAFGTIGGLLELAVFLLKCRYFDPRNINASEYFPLMFLGASLLFAGCCALFLMLLVKAGLASNRFVFFGLGFITTLGVLFRLPIATLACLILAAGISWRLAVFLAPRSRAFDRGLKRLILTSGLIAAAVVFAQGSVSHKQASHAANVFETETRLKNVLLIVLDTMRADRLSAPGDPGGLTPNLARYAQRGVRFEQAYSTAPWTAPSHASMFTGRWPHELKVGWNHPLESQPPTLAEALNSLGLKTAGFVANTTYCSYETGLNRGFEHYEDYDVSLGNVILCSSITQRILNFLHQHPTIEQSLPAVNFAAFTRKDASRIRNDFEGWLARQGKQPFFAFLNFFDAHHPYLVPKQAEPGLEPSRSEERLLKTWWEADKRSLSRADVKMVSHAYDNCVRYLDAQIGRLLDDLERQGILKDTLVVISSDHGEELGERRLYGHGCSLYRSELHVPLLILGEGVVPSGIQVSEPVTLRDLPATVFDLLDVEPKSAFPGQSLARNWQRDAPNRQPSPLLSEIDGPPEVDPNLDGSPARKGPMRSLVAEGYHYIKNGDADEELYSLESDVLEEHDLASDLDQASRLGRFRKLLASQLQARSGFSLLAPK